MLPMNIKEKDYELPNVIFIEKSIHDSKEEMIEEYIDILKHCKTAQDFYALFSLVYDDIVAKTGQWIIERQIQDKVRTLEKIKIRK